jgi:chemotaxis protein methyltransferase CheR
MDDFGRLIRFIEQTIGIRCSSYKEDYIKRRLLSRMRSTNCVTYQDYLNYLKANPAELEKLRNALTINVTEFFRDSDVYELIKKEIFPALIQQKKRLHIWCAGCSTGEEPYSLAMILSDLIAQNPLISARIYATDIDQVVLQKAKEGLYPPKTMVKLSESQIRRHFTKLPDGNFLVKPHVKELIRFRPHDLMSGVPVAQRLDLITCRNVTIYFNEHQKDSLARMFHGALGSRGFYIMGKTEYLGRTLENLFESYNSLQKVFIKKD